MVVPVICYGRAGRSGQRPHQRLECFVQEVSSSTCTCTSGPLVILSCSRSSNKQHKTDKMTDRKAVIKNADMSEDMQQDAVDCATQAIEKYNIEKVTKTAILHDI